MSGFRFASVLAVAVLLMGSTGHEGGHNDHDSTAAATEKDAEIDVRQMQGEIVDITCYMRHDSRGPEHVKCAVFCANLGMPLGFLEEGTGSIFLVLPSGHADPKEAVLAHIGQPVKVEGILWSSGGLTGIEIVEIEQVAAAKSAD